MNEWQDIDKEETREWQDAILAVIAEEGPERGAFLAGNLIDQARRNGAHLPYSANTAYVNSIPPMAQKPMPGNAEYEHKIRSYVRWNALAMVVRANRKPGDLGGHIASFASAAVLYDVGFNHFSAASCKTHRRIPKNTAIWFIFKAIQRPAFMRARFWRDESTKSKWKTSARK